VLVYRISAYWWSDPTQGELLGSQQHKNQNPSIEYISPTGIEYADKSVKNCNLPCLQLAKEAELCSYDANVLYSHITKGIIVR